MKHVGCELFILQILSGEPILGDKQANMMDDQIM
jgi:hypothetical protein